MCGRYAIARPERIVVAFNPDIVESDLRRPRYNIAPMQQVPVLARRGDRTALADCQWGFTPAWAKDPSVGNRMINARSETVAVKPAFRSAFRGSRCLVPADGFYEWQATDSGKQPFFMSGQDDEPFTFAGLYSLWTDPATGKALPSCVIVTKEADSFMAPVHDRMPLIVRDRERDAWMDPGNHDDGLLQRVLEASRDIRMRMTKVSKLVNSAANDDERCVRPAEDQASLFT